MTKLPDLIRSGQVEAPDLFCGGTPCQAFSVAGLRQSLDDERGNLSLTFCEIADAIDEKRKSIIFWENVPGVLSTKDNAFGCFLGALAGENDAFVPPGGRWANAGFIDGPKRAVAWRVLDAQYFGVAQRRRRVFVVASARADFDPAAVLFEFDGLRRDTAPSREAGQSVAASTGAGTAGDGLGTDFDLDGGVIAGQVCPTLRAGGNSTGGDRPPGTDVDTADSLIVQQPYEVGNCLTARMHKGINSTLDEGQTPVVALQDVTPREKAQNGRGWNDDGTAYTVDTHATQGVAQPINIYGGVDCENNAHGSDDVTGLLLKGSPTGGGRPLPAIALQSMAVRRLTPVECERLQGFPDNYTNIKDKCPDGPRYKALGNSWAVPVVRWIGERIARSVA
jgi:DNA (cytosine-5)-methyltransferase 1